MLQKIKHKILNRAPWLKSTFFYRAYYSRTDEGIRLHNMLFHKEVKGYPKREGILIEDMPPTAQDIAITKRLLQAYQKAVRDGKREQRSSDPDIWSFLKQGPHAEFIKLLESEDIDALAFYLCNMSRMGITTGLIHEYTKIVSDPVYRRWVDRYNLDKLITLAEALSVLPYEDPEQGDYGANIFSDVDEIIAKIEKLLQIPLLPPIREGGLYNLKTKKGSIHSKDIYGVYAAWRYKELLRDVKNPSICEIGAGVGKTAYYAWLLGLRRYTIIDLPYMNVIHGFYLLKCLPSAPISLYGEKKKTTDSFISILPDCAFKKLAGKQFDLTFDQDSFPEFDRKTLIAYLQQIKAHTKTYFFSINQESQNTMMIDNLKQHIISKLVEETKGYRRLYRFPYWLRAGYVEELYEIVGKADHADVSMPLR